MSEVVPFAAKFRDFVEQIAIAVVLALLFRGFEGEAFVIPTGSMAPTLMGMHKDVTCDKCGHEIRVGAVIERRPMGTAQCPSCRYINSIDPREKNEISFSGDRIVVNKFAYQFWEPERWDVIVFKYPGNPKQNYIKRLVGLPGEKIEVFGGDVYRLNSTGDDSGTGDNNQVTILRKPPDKVHRLLQIVHDSAYVAPDLVKAGWPAAWGVDAADINQLDWKVAADQRSFRIESKADDVAWLHYRHLPPSPGDWREIEQQDKKFNAIVGGGRLIADYCGYNAYVGQNDQMRGAEPYGAHWVGDLAIECEVDIESLTGELWLDLVEAGRHHRCQIDVATGMATLMIDGGEMPFNGGTAPTKTLTGQTKVTGAGQYDIRFTNVDQELILWVNNKVVSFRSGDETQPARYTASDDRPKWSPTDSGDLNPVRIGGRGLTAGVGRLRVLRDTYYVAASSLHERTSSSNDYDGVYAGDIAMVFADPTKWEKAPLFERRRHVEFTLGADQYFPMGDNSPASKDARLWGGLEPTKFSEEPTIEIDPFVTRERLIGKAFFVYWPHPWQVMAGTRPVLPNIRRISRIR